MKIQKDLSRKPGEKKKSQFMLEQRDGSVAVVVTHQELPLDEERDNKAKYSQR